MAAGLVLTAIAFPNAGFTDVLAPPMQPAPNHAPWQIAPVSATSRTCAAALALLAIDSAFLWSMMPSMIVAAALTAIPGAVAIRVIRGFPRSRQLAAATFASLLAIAIAALFGLGRVAGQASAAIVVAIALAASGLLTLAWNGLRKRLGGEPVLVMPRWPSAPVAVRSPSRYRSHRRYH